MNEASENLVKKFVSTYIPKKPKRITLKLDWNVKGSSIKIVGEGLEEEFRYDKIISFSSFAHGILEAYREAYGKLEVIPVSFREDIYENDKVSLDLYPTGSMGVFDIFIEYKKLKRD